jgi:hypothetical protein
MTELTRSGDTSDRNSAAQHYGHVLFLPLGSTEVLGNETAGFHHAARGAAAWPLVAGAQPQQVRRIGVLMHVTQNDPDSLHIGLHPSRPNLISTGTNSPIHAA